MDDLSNRHLKRRLSLEHVKSPKREEHTLCFLVNANRVSPDVNGYGGRSSVNSKVEEESDSVPERLGIE